MADYLHKLYKLNIFTLVFMISLILMGTTLGALLPSFEDERFGLESWGGVAMLRFDQDLSGDVENVLSATYGQPDLDVYHVVTSGKFPSYGRF